jgi:xylulokinase
MTLTLGIDVGTFEAKGVLVDGAGRVVATAARRHELIVPRPGRAEHRADDDWWAGVTEISRRLVATVDAGEIAAVGISAIGPCMLPVDGTGRPLTNAVLYGVDTRAEAEVRELTGRIGEETLLERTGNALTSQSVGPKILWLRRNRPEVFAETAAVHTSTSYLVFRLTGERVIDHYTAASFGPLYDLERQAWTADLADDIVRTEGLPRPAWTTEIAGQVTGTAAGETGLRAGTPVTVGTIDAAAEAVSVGVLRPGEIMVMYGSTIFVIAPTAGRVRDPRLWTAPWLFPGRHAAMAGLATSGTLTHWFRDRFARELDTESAFALLAAEAEAVPPGAEGLVLLPYFSGERTPIHDPLARGVLFGLNLTHGRGHVYRALLEGIAFGTGHVLDTYAEAGASAERIRAVGGGTRNPVWLHATSDISGLPQELCRETVGASYGDAFLAAVAIGAAAPDDIERWNPAERRVEPNEAARAVYARLQPVWRGLYPATRELMATLAGV